jgi:ATP-dependent Zn protease
VAASPDLSRRVAADRCALGCLAVIAVAFGALLGAPADSGAKAAKPKRESYSTFLSQLSRGQVKAAVLVPKKRTLRARLRTGARYVVRYPAKDDRLLVKRLHQQHVHVSFKKPHKKHRAHIRRRYIALGILAVAVGVALVAWYLRRRRPGPGTGPIRS